MKVLKFIGFSLWILVSVVIGLVLFPLSIILMCTIILAPIGFFMFFGTAFIVSAPFLVLMDKPQLTMKSILRKKEKELV